ncbi:heme exporter protein CcmD [Asaia bogorensis]|uniref:heme exporter protein CcmD n=1 Tax=Asaia bogorensis TaxID=91915 RepID=UPI00285F5BB1|nr:heme exporter protein CcmD [Asaia bogorensis]MDR6182657.1 heme exporter protein CcmD [Asaia bogorensis NBRC 16594]
MTHLPYIVASYAVTLVMIGAFTLPLVLRLRRARARLALLEQRQGARQRSTGSPETGSLPDQRATS